MAGPSEREAQAAPPPQPTPETSSVARPLMRAAQAAETWVNMMEPGERMAIMERFADRMRIEGQIYRFMLAEGSREEGVHIATISRLLGVDKDAVV